MENQTPSRSNLSTPARRTRSRASNGQSSELPELPTPGSNMPTPGSNMPTPVERTPNGAASSDRRQRSSGRAAMSSDDEQGDELPTPNENATPTHRRRRRRSRNDLGGGFRYGERNWNSPAFTNATADGDDNPMSQEDVHPEVEETTIWGTRINTEDCRKRFVRFLKNFRTSPEDMDAKYMRHLEETVETQAPTFNVDCMDLYVYDPVLYNNMVRYPMEVIQMIDDAIEELADERLGEVVTKVPQALIFNLKDKVHMRDLNPSDIDQLVAMRGMIIRCSQVIPEIKAAFFKCTACHHSTDLVHIDRGRIHEPTRCPRQACEARGSMQMVHNRSTFANKQIVRLQETPDAIPEGETPHTVSLCVYDTLVDACKPGDRVEVTGVFRATPVRESSNRRTMKSLFKTYIDCIHIKKTEKGRLTAEDQANKDKGSEFYAPFAEGNTVQEDYEQKAEKLKELARQPDIYEKLTRSIAPSIWELDDIKRGLLCQLFGGTVKKLESSKGHTFRGDLNVLLVGDPGTSKSQLLQYVHKIAPRGIYTSGRGSSAVGLTVYVTRDPETREMVLESGALVLSDRGICCIDEFDKMSDSARSMLHEVMEQQTVSVAKAGIIATLNARTSVLASANPSGSRYNPRLSVIDNIQLPPTLLSRFDLIYLVLDKPDEANDRRLARHLIALHFDNPETRQEAALDLNTLTSFISYARQHITPEFSDEAAEDLIKGYIDMRKLGGNRKTITATPRQLESLIRISEALAKMRFSERVERSDVAEALRLLKVAMQQSATDPGTGMIDMDLINTGVSASERTRKQQLLAAVKDLILERFNSGSSTMRVTQIWEEMKKQTSMEVPLNDVREALLKLSAEGTVKLAGENVTRG